MAFLEQIQKFSKEFGLTLIPHTGSRRLFKFEFYNAKNRIFIYRSKNYDTVHVYDLNTNEKLDDGSNLRYEKPQGYNVIDPEDEKYFIALLKRVVNDLPFILSREDELAYFNLCEKGITAIIDNESLRHLQISDCKIFNYHSITEDRMIRCGKDDRFELTEINQRFIMYKGNIISNEYLQSLLPKRTKDTTVEYAYASTLLGPSVMSFKLDVIQTELFRNRFSKESRDFFRL